MYVISFDPEKRKISLGVKDRTQNPWDVFMNTYKVGDVANVRIVKLMTFGAFAEVVPGVDGLIHISQIADRRIDKPSDVLSEGQMVDAKITAIDEEKKTASVYLKPDQVSLAIGKGGLNIRLSKMLTGYDIDVYREIEEEDVALTEFADEIDGWVIDALKACGCDTAKSVLELPVEEIAARADLELEQAQKVVEILKAEFEE